MTVKYKGKILESIKWEKTKENLVNEVEDVELLTKKEKTEENIQKLIKKNNRKGIFKLEKLFKNLLELIKKNNRKEIFKLEFEEVLWHLILRKNIKSSICLRTNQR